MQGSGTMPSRSHSEVQNPGKGKRIFLLEPIYFLPQRAVEFWESKIFLLRAFGGIEDLSSDRGLPLPPTVLQSYLQFQNVPSTLADLRRGCSLHLFPFRCDWSQNSMSERNLQIQNQRRQWFNKLQNKSKRDLLNCPLFFFWLKLKKKSWHTIKEETPSWTSSNT